MKRLLLVAFCAMSIGACTPLFSIPNPVSRTDLGYVEATYGTALALMVGYRNSCASKVIPPSCRPVVEKLQSANAVAKVAIDNAHAFVKNNPTVNASSLIAAAQAAVDAFRNIEAQNGVR